MLEKIDPCDAKDRLVHVKEKNSPEIVEMIQTLIDQDPFDGKRFYIFAHKRTIGMDERWTIWSEYLGQKSMEEIPDHRILWQSRLTKPNAQENSMLFKVDPKNPEEVKIIWILPEKEKFDLYQKGKFFQDQITQESIHNYLHDKERLEAPESDDLDDQTIRNIYLSQRLKGTSFKI